MKFKKYKLYSVKWGTPPRKKKKRPVDDPSRPFVEEGIPEDLYQIYRYMPRTAENYKAADRANRLRIIYPSATAPELLTLEWLIRWKHDYYYQPSVHGGRRRQGGLVPDFLVMKGGFADAWLIQGDYYHSETFQRRFNQRGRDATASIRLKGQVVEGARIRNVVQIRETSIYSNADRAFRLALSGISN